MKVAIVSADTMIYRKQKDDTCSPIVRRVDVYKRQGIYQSDLPPDFAYVPGGPWCKIKQIVNEKVKRISAVTVRSHERKSIT